MIFAGKRKKRTFRIGDRVLVRVLRADIDSRRIDLGLIDGPLDASPSYDSLAPKGKHGKKGRGPMIVHESQHGGRNHTDSARRDSRDQGRRGEKPKRKGSRGERRARKHRGRH